MSARTFVLQNGDTLVLPGAMDYWIAQAPQVLQGGDIERAAERHEAYARALREACARVNEDFDRLFVRREP